MKKKNILLVGASSASAISLVKKYGNIYNFICLSRDSKHSIVENFDLNDDSSYYNGTTKYDGLVYFPGTINLNQFSRLKIDDFYNDFDINVMGFIKVLKYYLSYLNEGSSIVLFSTVASKIGMPFHSSVSIVKSSIDGLCKSLAAEFAPKHRVNCISPSLFESKMSQRFLRSEVSANKIKEKNPLKKIGSSEDISNLVAFLISDESKWITGQNISVDGGMSSLKI
jgi:NAD(P)-dependent dehydrogenase (short-subunit alcohol dehydrogenase family)